MLVGSCTLGRVEGAVGTLHMCALRAVIKCAPQAALVTAGQAGWDGKLYLLAPVLNAHSWFTLDM